MNEKNSPTGKTPTSPWQLNRARIIIILMVALALATILGSTLGGSMSSYEALKEGASAQTAGN